MLTEKELIALPLDPLLKLFDEAARLHGAFTKTGEYKKVNAAYYSLVRVYKEIKRRGLPAQMAFLVLLDSDVLSVRVWVASFALEFAPGRAEPTLNEIVKTAKGHPRTDAEMVLQEWKSGNLRFP